MSAIFGPNELRINEKFHKIFSECPLCGLDTQKYPQICPIWRTLLSLSLALTSSYCCCSCLRFWFWRLLGCPAVLWLPPGRMWERIEGCPGHRLGWQCVWCGCADVVVVVANVVTLAGQRDEEGEGEGEEGGVRFVIHYLCLCVWGNCVSCCNMLYIESTRSAVWF